MHVALPPPPPCWAAGSAAGGDGVLHRLCIYSPVIRFSLLALTTLQRSKRRAAGGHRRPAAPCLSSNTFNFYIK